MKNLLTLFCLLIFSFSSLSQELVISGNQESTIAYTIEQNIEVPQDIKGIRVSFVEPQNFNSLTYIQEILGVNSIGIILPHLLHSRHRLRSTMLCN